MVSAESTSGSNSTSGTSITWSHTTGSGSNRALIVGVSYGGAGDVSGVTYNGVALTFLIRNVDTGRRTELWGMVGPASGAHDVVVSFASDAFDGIAVGAVSFEGVDQTTPFGTAVSDSRGPGSETNTPTVNASSASGEMVADVVALYNDTITVGASQTERWRRPTAFPDASQVSGTGSTEPGAGTVTMSWTMGAVGQWSICAVPLHAAAVAEQFLHKHRSNTLLRM